MKKILVAVIIFAIQFSTTLLAQRSEHPGGWGKMSGKIEQLEKIKIIEELNMDEETTLKFFARRNEHRVAQKKIIKKRDQLFKTLSENFDSEENVDYKEKMKEVFEIEEEMLSQRENFLTSLSDILTEKQVAQLILFEFNFRNEVRHQFMKQGQRRMKRK